MNRRLFRSALVAVVAVAASAPLWAQDRQASQAGKSNQAESSEKAALAEHKAVYLGATGGAGALLSQRITDAKVIAYEDLGPEAIRELTVKDFPLLVINDCHGGELYVKPNLG